MKGGYDFYNKLYYEVIKSVKLVKKGGSLCK
jgi:hypothetical protein